LADRSRISKLLSLILRHRPDEFGLNIDEYGFISLKEVVDVLLERYDEATDEAVRDLVADKSQHRFEIVDERIRALYGHSFFVEMDGDVMDPPEKLYMGTTAKAGIPMEADGIRPVDRSYLHLSTSYDSAESRSRQVGTPCVVEILAKKAHESGIEFYQRGEVVLTRQIPSEFVSQVHGLSEAVSEQQAAEQAAPKASRPAAAPRAAAEPAKRDAEVAAQVVPTQAAFGRRPRKATGRRG
jgi:putative RNA 2'-phosphotransferase